MYPNITLHSVNGIGKYFDQVDLLDPTLTRIRGDIAKMLT